MGDLDTSQKDTFPIPVETSSARPAQAPAHQNSKPDIAHVSDSVIAEFVLDNVKTVFEYIGEGCNGDYDPNDSSDVQLLRFTGYVAGPNGTWVYLEDSSWCTDLPISYPKNELSVKLQDLATQLKVAISKETRETKHIVQSFFSGR